MILVSTQPIYKTMTELDDNIKVVKYYLQFIWQSQIPLSKTLLYVWRA